MSSIAFVLNCDIDFTSQAVLLDTVVPVVTADLREIRAPELVIYFSALNNLNHKRNIKNQKERKYERKKERMKERKQKKTINK